MILFTFDDFTQEQLQSLKGDAGERGPKGENSTQRNYRDIKIYLDLPMRFNDYDELTKINEITYYSPQGLAVDDKYIFVLYDSLEVKIEYLLYIIEKGSL